MKDRPDQAVRDEWARYQLGARSVADLPAVGLRLLTIKMHDPDLADLAVVPPAAPRPLAENAFDRFGAAQDLPFLIDTDRRFELGWWSAEAIDAGRLDPASGAQMIRQLLRVNDDTGREILDEDLQTVAGLASLLSEYPDQRDEILTSVLDLVRSFLRHTPSN